MLGYILVIGALLLGLASGLGLGGTADSFVEGLLARSTLELLGIVAIIEMLTVLLEDTGGLQRMLVALRRVIQDVRILIALVPSVLGLFPIPGGAILTAPVVDKYGDELGMDADAKAGVNLFFRHVWDQVFPFKPHLILAATVLNIPLFTLIGWQLVPTLAAVMAGHWYLVGRKRAGAPPEGIVGELPPSRPLAIDVAPFVIPLVLGIFFGLNLVYAMALGLLFGVITQGAPPSVMRKMMVKGIRPRLLFVLVAVMVFKTVVEKSGLVGVLADILAGYGIPVVALVAVLPLVVGAATGLEVAVVALVYPLLMGLIPDGAAAMPYILVMMVTNAVGATLSPAHLCMAAGNEFYGASLARVIQINLLPQAFRVAVTVLFAWGVSALNIV